MSLNTNQQTTQEALNQFVSTSNFEKRVALDGTGNNGKIAAAATLATALTGSNNDIDFTAATSGLAGNDITIEYEDTGVAGESLAVTVTDNAIKVTLARSTETKATLTTSLTGTNNDFKLTARDAGVAGNSITLTLVDPSANDATLSVDVSGTDITVNLATDGAGAITTTASDILTAINYDADAQDLVTVTLAAANDGTGVVTALTQTALTGGLDNAITTTGDDIKTAIAGDVDANALVSTSDHSGNDGSGLVTVMAATNLSGGSDGWIDLFTLDEDSLVTVWGSCQEDVAGATGTLTVGYTANTDAFLASTVGTTIDAGGHFDSTGVLAAEAAPATTPSIFVQSGTVVRAYVGTASLTGGTITFHVVTKRP